MRLCGDHRRLRHHTRACATGSGVVVSAGGGADMPWLVVYPPLLLTRGAGDMGGGVTDEDIHCQAAEILGEHYKQAHGAVIPLRERAYGVQTVQ